MPNTKALESNLWKWLVKAKPQFREDLHIMRVENEIMSGMPDVEGCLAGAQFWCELKSSARPVRETTNISIKFQPKQPSWIFKRSRAGGRIFVLTQVGSGADARRYLVDGKHVYDLKEGMSEADIKKLAAYDGRQSAADTIRAMCRV